MVWRLKEIKVPTIISLLASLSCVTLQGQNLREYFLNNGLNLTTTSPSAKQWLHAVSLCVLQDFCSFKIVMNVIGAI